MKKMINTLIAILLSMTLNGCFEANLDTPEALLQHYIYLAFRGVDEAELEKYLSQDFLNKIREEQKTATTPLRQISFKNLKLKTYKVLNKHCEKETECQIRFAVSYEELNSNNKNVDFATETTKIAMLKFFDNKEWKIVDIDHLLTLHEIKEEISIPSKP